MGDPRHVRVPQQSDDVGRAHLETRSCGTYKPLHSRTMVCMCASHFLAARVVCLRGTRLKPILIHSFNYLKPILIHSFNYLETVRLSSSWVKHKLDLHRPSACAWKHAPGVVSSIYLNPCLEVHGDEAKVEKLKRHPDLPVGHHRGAPVLAQLSGHLRRRVPQITFSSCIRSDLRGEALH